MRNMPSRTHFLRPLLPLLILVLTACGAESTPLPHPAAVPAPPIPLAQVLAAVRKAPAIRSLPADLTPSLAAVGRDVGFDSDKCEAGPAAEWIDACVFGDPASSTKVVLYGDAHAGMWLPALSEIAQRRHWQLRLFGKPFCPAPALEFSSSCDKFRAYAEGQIQAEHPDLVLVADDSYGQPVTAAQWQSGLTRTLAALRRSGARVVVIGDSPVLAQSPPECLTAHPGNIAACFTTRAAATGPVWNAADQAAAHDSGAGYVSVAPWLCSRVCTPVIGHVLVYRNRFAVTATYSRMLNGVLETALLNKFPQLSGGASGGVGAG